MCIAPISMFSCAYPCVTGIATDMAISHFDPCVPHSRSHARSAFILDAYNRLSGSCEFARGSLKIAQLAIGRHFNVSASKTVVRSYALGALVDDRWRARAELEFADEALIQSIRIQPAFQASDAVRKRR